jgi:putative membrane protein
LQFRSGGHACDESLVTQPGENFMQPVPISFLTVGLALILSSGAFAQAPGTAQQPARDAAMKSAGADVDFAHKAATGGKHEVEGAKIASGKASNPAVKSYANMLVKDHTAANNELMSLMKKKQITPPATTEKPAEAWRQQTGAAFDRAYVDHAIAEHEKDIALFEAESKNGQDAELKAWAGKKLPTLRDHLKQAQDLKSKLQSTSSR